ncbi:alpha/beta fold hydrolase [Lampropedia puyangensis]|uniref:Alpha/beta fold hydrolase n=1 Tax=Lampropedia puyangensis TaxID=1330072 RepID=A0A4S8ETQ5_9BURK|nr:alpha/beta hydrolase [Lampropedia puyangensis]THT98247.1 alpha/beta fold hydrolase [Lampropedia puyangensis]
MPNNTFNKVSHIVLIHGAWQGSWAFQAWVPHLQAAGWNVHAVDLPGNGVPATLSWPTQVQPHLQDYTAHVLRVLDSLDGPAVVVGHSGGGMTASQVAQERPHAVAALVYLAGMMLPHGWSLGDAIDACQQAHPQWAYEGIGPHLQWDRSGHASSVPEAVAQHFFLHDCEPEHARQVARHFVWQPESGRAMRNHLTPECFGTVPRIYVECLRDRSILLALQRHMQTLSPGASRLSLDCGHVPQLACPALLTQQLLLHLEQRHFIAPTQTGADFAVSLSSAQACAAQETAYQP